MENLIYPQKSSKRAHLIGWGRGYINCQVGISKWFPRRVGWVKNPHFLCTLEYSIEGEIYKFCKELEGTFKML